MEMHQVRYFLAVARTLNFTRAAEECHVAQPSLTRAIKLLEGELGGDLFRRERPHAMLTPLGERMFPLLKQCYDSAQSARALASMAAMSEELAGMAPIKEGHGQSSNSKSQNPRVVPSSELMLERVEDLLELFASEARQVRLIELAVHECHL